MRPYRHDPYGHGIRIDRRHQQMPTVRGLLGVTLMTTVFVIIILTSVR